MGQRRRRFSEVSLIIVLALPGLVALTGKLFEKLETVQRA